MRPRQWVKNLLVFAAPVAAGRMTDLDVALGAALAFLAFISASGGTYLLNDVRDHAADAAHPLKRHRPIAAGVVSVPLARVTGAALLAVALGLPVAFGAWEASVVIAVYVTSTTAYSYGLKHVPLLELVLVASGFFLRALAGGAATDVGTSQWFLIVTGFGALYVVTTKRYAELRDQGHASTRVVLENYTADVLREIRFSTAAVTLAAYVLWAFEEASSSHWPWMFELSIVPFTLAVYRYALAVHDGAGEAPEEIFLTDKSLMAYSAVWALLYGTAVYVS